MKRSTAIVTTTALLLAFVTLIGGTIYLYSSKYTAAEHFVRASLKDPSSAQFSETHVFRIANGHMVACGLVNAKNSFGAYVGSTPYFAVLPAHGFDGTVAFAPTQDDSVSDNLTWSSVTSQFPQCATSPYSSAAQ